MYLLRGCRVNLRGRSWMYLLRGRRVDLRGRDRVNLLSRNWVYLWSRSRAFLRSRNLMYLRCGAFWRSTHRMWLHCLGRLIWPNLLGHWPCCLGLRNGGPRQLAPYCRNRYRLHPFHGKGPGKGNRLRPAAVYRSKLGPIRAGRCLVLLLHSQFLQARLPQGRHFRRTRGKIHTSTAARIAHTIVGRDVGHVGNVSIVDDGVVHVRDLAVVVELVTVPISAVIPAADVPVAVVHAAVIADVAGPKSTVPTIAVRIIAPVSGSP
jgi:hypothetical protein